MDLGIAGRKAIVCASSKGLGKACALALAREGCEVVINGRDAATLAITADEITRATGVKVLTVAGDLATREGQERLLAACSSPDILINNNGGPPYRDFHNLTRQQMIDGLVANMLVAVELIQKVIEPMASRGFGRIVNITSASVIAPPYGSEISSGARAGLTINNILPGPFDTDRLRVVVERIADKTGASITEVTKSRASVIPAKRFGSPQELGAACAFLCSVHAGYMTGQNVLLDGGAFSGAF
jgi:3-oxoacyl-[acyl-carrier protein] reductase